MFSLTELTIALVHLSPAPQPFPVTTPVHHKYPSTISQLSLVTQVISQPNLAKQAELELGQFYLSPLRYPFICQASFLVVIGSLIPPMSGEVINAGLMRNPTLEH